MSGWAGVRGMDQLNWVRGRAERQGKAPRLRWRLLLLLLPVGMLVVVLLPPCVPIVQRQLQYLVNVLQQLLLLDVVLQAVQAVQTATETTCNS